VRPGLGLALGAGLVACCETGAVVPPGAATLPAGRAGPDGVALHPVLTSTAARTDPQIRRFQNIAATLARPATVRRPSAR
jgi:hypothetical protein